MSGLVNHGRGHVLGYLGQLRRVGHHRGGGIAFNAHVLLYGLGIQHHRAGGRVVAGIAAGNGGHGYPETAGESGQGPVAGLRAAQLGGHGSIEHGAQHLPLPGGQHFLRQGGAGGIYPRPQVRGGGYRAVVEHVAQQVKLVFERLARQLRLHPGRQGAHEGAHVAVQRSLLPGGGQPLVVINEEARVIGYEPLYYGVALAQHHPLPGGLGNLHALAGAQVGLRPAHGAGVGHGAEDNFPLAYGLGHHGFLGRGIGRGEAAQPGQQLLRLWSYAQPGQRLVSVYPYGEGLVQLIDPGFVPGQGQQVFQIL